MNFRKEIGDIGENLICEFIRKRGFKLIERNYRKRFGEIDIVAIAPDRTLVFIEVKTLCQSYRNFDSDENQISSLVPEDQLTKTKLLKLQKICSLYANGHDKLINENRGWRIDLAAIDLNENKIKQSVIRYYENI